MILKSHSLYGFIDGSIPCPEEFIRNEARRVIDQPNPEFYSYITQDQALMMLINATLSSTTLAHVVGYKISQEIWSALEQRFSSSTRSNIFQLKTALQTLSKGSGSINVYIQKMKEARDNLVAVAAPVDDEDIEWTSNTIQCF